MEITRCNQKTASPIKIETYLISVWPVISLSSTGNVLLPDSFGSQTAEWE